jgi:hypothetical protein
VGTFVKPEIVGVRVRGEDEGVVDGAKLFGAFVTGKVDGAAEGFEVTGVSVEGQRVAGVSVMGARVVGGLEGKEEEGEYVGVLVPPGREGVIEVGRVEGASVLGTLVEGL